MAAQVGGEIMRVHRQYRPNRPRLTALRSQMHPCNRTMARRRAAHVQVHVWDVQSASAPSYHSIGRRTRTDRAGPRARRRPRARHACRRRPRAACARARRVHYSAGPAILPPRANLCTARTTTQRAFCSRNSSPTTSSNAMQIFLRHPRKGARAPGAASVVVLLLAAGCVSSRDAPHNADLSAGPTRADGWLVPECQAATDGRVDTQVQMAWAKTP